MKSVNTPLLSLMVLFFFTGAWGQDARKLIRDADYMLYKEDFPLAFHKYEYIHALYPDERNIDYHKEIAFHLTEGRGSSIEKLLSFESSKGTTDKFYNYWMGRIHFSRYEFDLAREHFEAFLKVEAYKSKEIIGETNNFIRWIDQAVPYYNDPNYYEIEPVQGLVNSPYADVSPAFFGGLSELLFLSNRPGDQGYEVEDFKVFYAFQKGYRWSDPRSVPPLGVFAPNSARIEVVNNDGKIFMYRENDGGDLFYSEAAGDSWSIPKEFDSGIKKSLVESHFFINDQENQIFFASGKGGNGLDLYESHYIPASGQWSDPIPVSGDEVNSIYDEDSPFLSHDGRYLYFSSNRPGGVGKMDVYQSLYDQGSNTWGTVENLGFPLNTVDDEIHFQLNGDDTTGYFSSDRLHGQGDFDIYYFHRIQKLVVRGLVSDRETGSPVAGAVVKFHPASYYDESFTTVTDASGAYQLKVIAKEHFATEVLVGEQLVDTGSFSSVTENFGGVLSRDFQVKKPVGPIRHKDFASLYQTRREDDHTSLEMLGSKFREGSKVILNNVYFDFDSDELIVDNEHVIEELFTLMLDYPELVVEIGGHTDNMGPHDFNMDLSERRARKIVALLIQRGIDPQRLQAVGYGETQPLASNDDEIHGREINRRIEVKVIESRASDWVTDVH